MNRGDRVRATRADGSTWDGTIASRENVPFNSDIWAVRRDDDGAVVKISEKEMKLLS